MNTATARKTTLFTARKATPPGETWPVMAMPVTTARVIRPRMSSTTAAPSTTLAAGSWSRPRSASTRTGMTEPGHEAEADREGHDDPDQRDNDRLGSGLQQPREIGLEPDLEQEDQHAELGERVDDLGLVHEPEDAGTDHDARQQLAEDGGLADSLHPLGRQLGGEPDDDERDQQLAEFH